MESSSFGQDLKGPDKVNWIKGAFAQYDKTVILDSSLIPLPVLNYQSQLYFYTPSWTHTSKLSLTTYTANVLVIALTVYLNWRELTLNSPPTHY